MKQNGRMNYYHLQCSQHHHFTVTHSIFSLVLETDPPKRGTVRPTDTDLHRALVTPPAHPCFKLPDSFSHQREARVAVTSCIHRLLC